MICPESLRLETSAICQLSCPLCPFRKQLNRTGKGLLAFDDFQRLIRENPGIRKIDFAGRGEPFLQPELARIIHYAFERNIGTTFSGGTNMNNVSEEALEALVFCGTAKLRCSIDGVTQETYKKYRIGGSLKNVIRNIEKINTLKAKYGSKRPLLIFQFIAFGHNEQEIERAMVLARLLDMQFLLRLNYSTTELPVKERERIQRYLGYADRSDYLEGERKSYYRDVCLQLWKNPQVAWNGDFLGCICNKWGAFDGNAFLQGLEECANGERITYARAMLMGQVPQRGDIPCAQCEYYERMARYRNWITEDELRAASKTGN
jgi:MoaA/NifB/PqqE/SkfB family radical SAM enzyme